MKNEDEYFLTEEHKIIDFETLGKPSDDEEYRAFYLMTVPHGVSEIMLTFKVGVNNDNIIVDPNLKKNAQTFYSSPSGVFLKVRRKPDTEQEILWMDRAEGLYHPAVLGTDTNTLEIPDKYSLKKGHLEKMDFKPIGNSTRIKISESPYKEYIKELNNNSRIKGRQFRQEKWFNPKTNTTQLMDFTRINTPPARDKYIKPYSEGVRSGRKMAWAYNQDDPFSYTRFDGYRGDHTSTESLDSRGNMIYTFPPKKKLFLIVYKGHANMGKEYTDYVDQIKQYPSDKRTFAESGFKKASWKSVNTAVTITCNKKMTKSDKLAQILEQQIGGLECLK